MSLDSLITKLETRDVTADTGGNDVAVTPITNQIKGCTLVTSVTDKLINTEQEAFEERAAIMEFDGGLPREGAEKLAKAEIINLRRYKNDKRT